MMIKKFTLVIILILFILIPGCGKKTSQQKNEMVINSGLSGKIKSMDPLSIRDYTSSLVAYNIFEQLYQYHYLKRPFVTIPLLAESMPQISDDKLTYTIKIKKRVFFQDDKCFPDGKGRELKAEDFVYALKRIADIKNLSENWYNLNERIVGLDEFREYTKTCEKADDVDYKRKIEGLYTTDDYTLVFKLIKPWPDFINTLLIDGMSSPIAKEAVDYYGKDIINNPVGTGPFMLEEWRRGSYVTLVRNPNYRDERYPSEGEEGDLKAGLLDDVGKKLPFVYKIMFRIIEEQQPAWFLFMQGKLDAKAIPKDNWAEAIAAGDELTEKMKKLNIKLKTFIQPSVFWIGFNLNDPVLGKNKPLRCAISYAIDRQKHIDVFFNGRDLIAHGFISPGLNSYDPDIKKYGFAEYNPDKARELLKKAEKIHGDPIPTLTMGLPGTSTYYRQVGELYRREFEDVGLNVEMQFMDWPTYQSKQNKSQMQIFGAAGAVATTTDAIDFFDSFYSKKKAPGPNKFNYSNHEYDKLYEKAKVMSPSQERKALYRKMELMILKDCPAAFTSHRVAYVLVHDWYENYKPNVFQYGVAKYRKINLEKKAAYKELLKKVK